MAAKNHRKKRTKSFSYALYIFYVLILLIIIGDIIGIMLYMRLDDSSRRLAVNFVYENIYYFDDQYWSFNQLFYRQFMAQGSMWVLGLSLIGVVGNLFLVFLRGVTAGFNIFFIFQTLGFVRGLWVGFLWLLQYILILGVTVLSGYFSIRFVIITIKIIWHRKGVALLKKHLLNYFYQLVIITVLTLVTTSVTYLLQPIIYTQFSRALENGHNLPDNNIIVLKKMNR